MASEDRRICGICAWRQHCQKRFRVSTDAFLNVNCADYTRDLSIKVSPSIDIEDSEVTMERMVEDQLKKWRALIDEGMEVFDYGYEGAKVKGGPVITISREPGAGGSEIARRLAKLLGMDLMGGQIIQHVAESAKMSRKVIESLDEKAISTRDSWLTSLFTSRHIWPDEYLQHLTKVIGTIGRYGNAIIVGRGAQFILPRDNTFRLRFIAPLETRIQNVMKDRGCSRQDAERYVLRKTEDRIAFYKKYFREDPTNAALYDLVLNTGPYSIDDAVKIVISAFKAGHF